ncbi:MAG: hypothetical protein ACE5G6_01295 [Terriglobia bacterium]
MWRVKFSLWAPSCAGLAVLAVFTCGFSQRLLAQGYRGESQDRDWRMEIPAGWIGGSADQIGRVLQSTRDPQMRRVLEHLSQQAQGYDAVFLHLELEGLSLPTMIYANKLPAEVFADLSEVRQFFESLGQRIRNGEPAGSQVELVLVEEDLSLTGHREQRGIFVVTRPEGQKKIEVWHLIHPTGGSSTYIFRFSADGRASDERIAEFESMLHSLQFSLAGRVPPSPGDFRTPEATVRTFFRASATMDRELLSRCFSSQAAGEFTGLIEQTASDDELEQLRKMFDGAQITDVRVDESVGKAAVAVNLRSRRELLYLVKEGEEWKIVDF